MRWAWVCAPGGGLHMRLGRGRNLVISGQIQAACGLKAGAASEVAPTVITGYTCDKPPAGI